MSISTNNSRWVLPNLSSALKWCKTRNSQGLGCTLDILGENVRTEKDANIAINVYLRCAEELQADNLDGAIAMKLSNLGAGFDRALGRKNLLKIFKETEQYNINLELDMEGKPMVEYTIQTAQELADMGYHVTLALQVYLNRTEDDLKNVLKHDIIVRLVKGAYLGDTGDFVEIQERFKSLIKNLLENGGHFSIGTHDPELIAWVKSNAVDKNELIEFGFLKGLADNTKLALVKAGWQVAEYVPFGADSRAYITRRQHYLNELNRLSRRVVD